MRVMTTVVCSSELLRQKFAQHHRQHGGDLFIDEKSNGMHCQQSTDLLQLGTICHRLHWNIETPVLLKDLMTHTHTHTTVRKHCKY